MSELRNHCTNCIQQCLLMVFSETCKCAALSALQVVHYVWDLSLTTLHSALISSCEVAVQLHVKQQLWRS